MSEAVVTASKLLQRLSTQLAQLVVCREATIREVLIALLCRGHLLLEDAPGLGKTTLAKAVARSLDLEFRRVQCTPDLMPADITGVSIFEESSRSFRFVQGPVFANILLVDEINRASPRTQSALLEAMAEGTVTADRETHSLREPFLVLATQNPVEFSGTYPLPEAQLDRFFMRVSMGYPSQEDEVRVMQLNKLGDPLARATPVLKGEVLVKLQRLVASLPVETRVLDYIAALIRATREHAQIRLGASPRGSIALMQAAQAQAVIDGTGLVTPQLVQNVFVPVIAHRILLRSANQDAEAVLKEIVAAVPVPGMPGKGSSSSVAPVSSSGLTLAAE